MSEWNERMWGSRSEATGRLVGAQVVNELGMPVLVYTHTTNPFTVFPQDKT